MGEAGDEAEVEDREGGGDGRHDAADIEMVIVKWRKIWLKIRKKTATKRGG